MNISINSRKTKIIIAVIMVLLVIFVLIKLTSRDEDPKTLEERVPAEADIKIDAYQIKNGKVQYREAGNSREIKGADIETFEAIDNNYARDKNRVYFKNFPIEGIEVATFEVIDEFYLKDQLQVYCSDISVYKKPIPEADAISFEKISGNFYKDKNNIFEKCHVSEIPNLDVETFEVVDEKTVKDKNGTYSIK